MPLIKPLCITILCLGMGACFNDNHERSVDLGSVSIGQQLIDLKAAREAEAISIAEYRKTRAALLQLLAQTACKGDDCDEIEQLTQDADDTGAASAEDDEGFSWL